MLREACREAARWHEARPDCRPLGLSVNVSGRQLGDGALELEVAAALADSGLPAEQLTLELTESALMEQRSDVVRALRALKALGVRLSIDDFGTGYSSLARLQRLPVDEVKIDRGFVAALGADGANPIVEAVLALGAGLGIEVVAEGIEHEGQLRALRDRGCRVGQGFAFSRPVDGDAVLRLAAGRVVNDTLNFSV